MIDAKRVTVVAAALAAAAAACSGGGANSSGSPSGNASSNSSGGSTGVGGDFGTGGLESSGGNGSGGETTCLETPQEAVVSPLDIIVVLDRSISMAGALWNGSVSSLTTFFQNPGGANIGAGISYFPPPSGGGQECQPASYDPPHEAIVDLTTDSATLISALQSETPTGDDTPIYAAMYGTIVYANNYQDANPDHVVVVVLASDGDPTACNTSIPDIAGVAATGFAYNGVRTFVVAIQGADLASLDQIAAAGGTTAAMDITSDITLFTQKMEEIRQQVLACEFVIPDSSGGDFDPTRVNVEYTPGNGDPPETIPQADGPGDCGSGPGWYYDNPSAPTKIIFCPATCAIVQADEDAHVDFLFGCPTELN